MSAVWCSVQDSLCQLSKCVHRTNWPQQPSQRLTEHKRAVNSADFNSLVLAEHAWSAGHPVDWEKTCVVSNCSDLHSRLVHEAFFIRSTKNTLNRDTGTLPSIYDVIVDAFSGLSYLYCVLVISFSTLHSLFLLLFPQHVSTTRHPF